MVSRPTLLPTPDAAERDAVIADRLVAEAQSFALSSGATTGAVTRLGDPATELLALSIELSVDLVVVGVQRREVGEGTLFLGHLVEHLLEHCPATVAVVVTPPGWTSH